MTTSPPAAIEVAGLRKVYGRQQVVDNVSFTVRPGSVTGFLGPNGAGKSTTLRILVGLASQSSGRAAVLGGPYAELPNPGLRVGVLLDASAQHSGRSGREALALSALVMGLPARRADEMLELLILDEPANGLDPAGIHWMRTLLRDFADRGGAVLLSSHLLCEIEVIADHIVVIGGGRILADGKAAGDGIPFARLARAELRKLTDTRVSRLLLAAIALATPIVIVVMLFVAAPQNLTDNKLVDYTQTPQKLLLPPLGILVITSEWSQRTGLVAFTLVPRRGRVLLAKFA
jgi:ABC-type multidrug transport system ATPase subunit